MVSTDISNAISQALGLSEFVKLQTRIQKINNVIGDNFITDWLIVSPLIDIHNIDLVVGSANLETTETPKYVDPIGYARRIPTTVRAYDLIHDNTNATGLTLPNPSEESTKFHGKAKTDGSSYQIINDHSWFDVSNLVIGVWLNLPSTQTSDSTQTILDKTDSFSIKIDPHSTASNQIRCSSIVSSASKDVTFSYTADTWFCLIVKINSTSIEVFKDNVSQGTTSTGSNFDTNSNNIGIFGKPDGSELLKSASSMSMLTFGDKDVDSTWRSNFQNGILDYESATDEEITTFPYLANYEAVPNSHAGFFYG
jgi:hypothetical protein